MSFASEAFFSPGMGRLRTSIRSVPEYDAWFKFAAELNRLCLDMLEGVEIPRSDNQRLVTAALFIRTHKSFQSAILLAEFGLLGDTRTVLRAAVEGAIALNVLAEDPGFVQRLINAHYHWQRKVARLVLGNPEYRSMSPQAEIAAMERTIEDVTARETAGVSIRDITWADEALRHCPDLYNFLYRHLSSDGPHTNINTIHRMFEYDAEGQATRVKLGPDIAGMVETLRAACLTILWAAEPFARIFGQTQDRINAGIRRFDELPVGEPPNARIEVHFDSDISSEMDRK